LILKKHLLFTELITLSRRSTVLSLPLQIVFHDLRQQILIQTLTRLGRGKLNGR